MFAEKRKAFSLIELLVVISVISLLTAILLPALVSAKRQGYRVVCQSNLRQLVLANIGYATENDGFYVAAASDMWKSFGGYHRWHGVRQTKDDPFDPLKGPLVAYLADGKVKECPGRPKLRKGPTWGESFEKGNGGYGYNMTYIGCRVWRGDFTTIQGWKNAYGETAHTSEIVRTAETLMFADSAFLKNGVLIEYSFAEPRYWVSSGVVCEQPPFPEPSIHFRHENKANIGWCDGHVDSRAIFESKDGSIYDGNRTTYKLGWFEPVDNSLFDLK